MKCFENTYLHRIVSRHLHSHVTACVCVSENHHQYEAQHCEERDGCVVELCHVVFFFEMMCVCLKNELNAPRKSKRFQRSPKCHVRVFLAVL